jgi:hypothetical protein
MKSKLQRQLLVPGIAAEGQQIEQPQNELLRTIRRREASPDSARKLTPSFGYFFRDPTSGRSVTGGNDLTHPEAPRQY